MKPNPEKRPNTRYLIPKLEKLPVWGSVDISVKAPSWNIVYEAAQDLNIKIHMRDVDGVARVWRIA